MESTFQTTLHLNIVGRLIAKFEIKQIETDAHILDSNILGL